MANNIFQRQVTPAKPNVLEGERIFVYVPQATTDIAGIASYNRDDFVVTNAGKVKIKWPYAHNGVFGLVKVKDDSAGYLKFTDDENHYLEVDSEKIKVEIVDAAITVHNESEEAHPYIQEKIQLAKEELIAHNESEEAHPYIREKIATDIDAHNESEEAHTNLFNNKVDKTVYLSGGPAYHIVNNAGGIRLKYDLSPNSTTKMLRLESDLFSLNGVDEISSSNLRIRSSISVNFDDYSTFIKLDPTNGLQLQSDYQTFFGKTTANTLKLTPTTFTLNEKNIALEEYVDNKVAEITAVHIRNKEPNLVVNATQDTVQEVATQYIVDNYGRQPEANDGLFITFTDKNNDVIKYAYFNNAWVNVGLNDIDLSNYVDKSSNETIGGHKNFTGSLTKNGNEVATETLVDAKIEQLDKDSRKMLILGGNGTIGTNVNFVIENPESFAIYKNNLTEFIMSLIVPVTGEIDLTKEVTIDFGDTSYYLFNAVNTTQRLTLGDLNFALRESLVTGYNYLFRAVFFNNADSIGFAVLPDRDEVLSLNSDQMDNYIAEGGLPNGQLAICKKVITNGYTEGGIYRFKITYPDTYEWEELSAGGSGGIKQLVGTTAKPINLATDLEAGQVYSIRGNIINSSFKLINWCLVHKITDVKLITYGFGMHLGSLIQGNNITGLIWLKSATDTTFWSSEGRAYYGLSSVNGNRGGAVNEIFAPTSGGTAGQILQSNGTGAPTWVDMSSSTPVLDEATITENVDGALQAVALKDKVIIKENNTIVKTNFNGIIELTDEEYEILLRDKTVTLSDGTVVNYDSGTVYVTEGLGLLQNLTLTQTGSVVTSTESFKRHVHLMIEFETDGMHYGTDFILHPYDTSICLVQYSFVGHTGTAYLDEDGFVRINVPDGLTFTNIKGHYMDLGG